MKTAFLNSSRLAALGCALSLTSLTATAATQWKTDFSGPGYTLNETVIGKEGWAQTVLDSGIDNDASIVLLPGDSEKRVMRIISTSEGTTANRRTIIYNKFETVVGEQVNVNIPVYYDFTGRTQTQVMSFALHETETLSPIIVRFTTEGGIYLAGTYVGLSEQSKNLLEGIRVAKNSLYDFNITLDFDLKRFDLSLTGVDVEGNEVDLLLSQVRFRTGYDAGMTGVNAVRLMNYRGELMTLYTGDISVTSIPESSTAAYLALGGALAAWKGRRYLQPALTK